MPQGHRLSAFWQRRSQLFVFSVGYLLILALLAGAFSWEFASRSETTRLLIESADEIGHVGLQVQAVTESAFRGDHGLQLID